MMVRFKRAISLLTASAPVRARAMVLLEVVLGLALLMIAMGVIGFTFRNGQYYIDRSEKLTRAMLMTEKIIVEMDSGLLAMDEREMAGTFMTDGVTESMPGMSFQVVAEPSPSVLGLLNIDINIYMGNPEDEETRQLILETHLVRPLPQGLDFERDFGLDQDQIEQLTDAIPGGAALFDPNNFDPRSLASLPIDQLVEILPTLLQAFGGQLGQGQIDQLLNAVESGDLGGLQNGGSIPGLNNGGGGNANAGGAGNGGGGGNER